MSTPNTTPATPAPAKPKIGVDICDGCGRPPAIVGPLDTHPKYTGICRVCAHDLARYDLLEDELVDILRAWYAASIERGFKSQEIQDLAYEATERLNRERSAPGADVQA